jgi:hypothetical protein
MSGTHKKTLPRIDPIGDDGGEVDGSQKFLWQVYRSECGTPEIFEPAETSLDHITPFLGAFAEAVEGHPVGFVWNDGLRAALGDFGAKPVAVVSPCRQ